MPNKTEHGIKCKGVLNDISITIQWTGKVNLGHPAPSFSTPSASVS